MRLDFNLFRFLGKDELRVLTSIEMGMKNHELVPTQLIESIAKLKRGGTFKILTTLLKYKLIQHDSKPFDGYALNYQGYDILAINVFVKRGSITHIGNKVGTGKESDIYLCVDADGNQAILKFARLGRTSFRQIKNKRDYLKGRSLNNWLYVSRIAAEKEYSHMKVLHARDYPCPTPIDQNRHVIVMSVIQGTPLNQVLRLESPNVVLDQCFDLISRFENHGVIHCDFNEFNLIVDEDLNLFVIDFPQMVSVNHKNAQFYFDRDVECVREYFEKKFDVQVVEFPQIDSDREREDRIDVELRASGYPRPKKESGRELDDSPSEDEDDEEGMLDDELIKEEKKEEDLDVENPEEEKGLQPDNESEEDDEDSDGEETAEEPVPKKTRKQNVERQIARQVSKRIRRPNKAKDRTKIKMRQEVKSTVNFL